MNQAQGSIKTWLRERGRKRVLAELKRIEEELRSLREIREHLETVSSWERLSDDPMEKKSGEEWEGHLEACRKTIDSLERRQLELQIRL